MANRGGQPERRRGQRRVTQRGRESPGATRRIGYERRRKESDPELREIQRLYAQLAAMHFTKGREHQTPAYQALVTQIRAVVDARTKIRGDEMIEAMKPVEKVKG